MRVRPLSVRVRREALAFGCVLALALTLQPGAGHADEPQGAGDDAPSGVYARVIVDRVELRSGPGATFRRVWVAERGDVFPITERGTHAYWFRVELPDGTQAYVAGDAVYAHELSAEQASRGRFLPEVFAPPALPHAVGELAFSFGVLGISGSGVGGGLMAVRPTINLAPELGIEATLGASVGAAGRLFFGTLGGIVNVFPTSPVVPFVVVGGGFARSDPNADAFLLRSGWRGAMYAGGGLRIGFRYRITLRLEARAWVFFDENQFSEQEEVSGGLTVFF
jgi:hypothetical protein